MRALTRRMIITSIASAFALTIATALPASASSSPTEYFTAVSTSPTGATTVVASGPIAAAGTDTVLGNHRDNFVFPDGTISVRHEPISRTQKFDIRTCTFTYSETGTYDLTKGTGAYAHVTGFGHYKAYATGTGCDQSQPPTSFVQTIEAHGPIELG